MAFINHIHLYTDGGSKGNPGPGSIGVVICDDNNKILHEFSECIGHCTNNVAEYRALIKGLKLCAKYTRKKVTAHCDSQLIVKQICGEFRVKKDALYELCLEVKEKAQMFDDVIYQQVPRTHQRLQHADKLNKQAHNGQAVDKSHRANDYQPKKKK